MNFRRRLNLYLIVFLGLLLIFIIYRVTLRKRRLGEGHGVEIMTLGGEQDEDYAYDQRLEPFWEIDEWEIFENAESLIQVLFSKDEKPFGDIPSSRRSSGFWALYSKPVPQFPESDAQNALNIEKREKLRIQTTTDLNSISGITSDKTTMKPDKPRQKCSDCIILDNFQNSNNSLWMGLEISLHIHGRAALFVSFKHDFGAGNVPIVWDPYDGRTYSASFCTEIIYDAIRFNGGVRNVMFLGRLYDSESVIVIDKITVVLGQKGHVERYMRIITRHRADNLCSKIK